MAQNLAQKKAQYLAAVVQAAVAFKEARDGLKRIAESWATSPVYSGIVQADIDAAASPPPVVAGAPVPVAHLTPAILANLITVVQPAVETATAAHLLNLLDALPT